MEKEKLCRVSVGWELPAEKMGAVKMHREKELVTSETMENHRSSLFSEPSEQGQWYHVSLRAGGE